ncbi:MAG TPA: tRNA (adenosine(37)-N6)-dimethylallyltransferase MiaA [Bacteroidales bacterium]|nr:tRNA (adenosine(37)-N6)-dimethylallyltransferase MiaA [Bacteroidales bacterium]
MKQLLVLLGPTATGKTALAAHVAYALGGEVISADSRQVYRGMDIGTGKDYGDYLVKGVAIPYHLIDIAEPGEEYNIYTFQHDFRRVYQDVTARNKVPILCGGSGMYLEAVLKGYRLPEEATDGDFLASLEKLSDSELEALLRSMKTLHNNSDLENRARMIKAIRIAYPPQGPLTAGREGGWGWVPDALIFGVDYPRGLVRARIRRRLEKRMEEGMTGEVEALLAGGIIPDRLMRYGLEYRFVTRHLLGEITKEELLEGLYIAICQFAKRQMTWFRRMERQGFVIHWIDGRKPMEEKVALVLERWKKESARTGSGAQ